MGSYQVVLIFAILPGAESGTPAYRHAPLSGLANGRGISDGRPGTYANGTKSNKIDYLLLSPMLFERVTGGGVWRKGVWGGQHGTLFPHYDEMTQAVHAASDHAAVWADITL